MDEDWKSECLNATAQVFKSLLSTWYLVTQTAAVTNGAEKKRTSAVNLSSKQQDIP